MGLQLWSTVINKTNVFKSLFCPLMLKLYYPSPEINEAFPIDLLYKGKDLAECKQVWHLEARSMGVNELVTVILSKFFIIIFLCDFLKRQMN